MCTDLGYETIARVSEEGLSAMREKSRTKRVVGWERNAGGPARSSAGRGGQRDQESLPWRAQILYLLEDLNDEFTSRTVWRS